MDKDFTANAHERGQQLTAKMTRVNNDRAQRAKLLLQLRAAQKRFLNSKQHFALFLIKIDNILDVEQDFGISLSQNLMLTIAEKLKQLISPDDCLVQLQNDEIALLKTQVSDSQSAIKIAHQLQARFRFSFQVQSYNIPCNCNIGISLQTQPKYQVQQILKDTDIALQTARKKGKSQYHLAIAKPIQTTNCTMLQQQERLAEALLNNDINPYYQPIIQLNSNRLIGFEVIAHWSNSDASNEDMNFTSLAERTDMIISLDLHIIKQACSQLKRWHNSHINNQQIILTISLSVKHLILDGAVEQLIFMIQQQQVPPKSLIFEFREQDFIAQNEFVLNSLNKLRAVGIRLGLDDFGKGFSSLNAFFKYPIDYIKIDHSFTNRMLMSKKDLSLIRVIRDISHDMGLHVIVEGIDNSQQHAKLVELGCEYGLGSYIAKPMHHDQANSLLEA